jgi:hypothetical protein
MEQGIPIRGIRVIGGFKSHRSYPFGLIIDDSQLTIESVSEELVAGSRLSVVRCKSLFHKGLSASINRRRKSGYSGDFT